MNEQRKRWDEHEKEDLRRAEAILHELALVLLRVPVGEQSRELHLRALALKRDVTRWHLWMPDEAVRHAVLDELLRLQQEASVWDLGPAREPARRAHLARWSMRLRGLGQDDGTT